MCNSKKTILIWCLVASLLLLVTSITLMYVVFPMLIKQNVEEKTRLENGTEQWDRFVKLPFPLEFKIYLFVVENADDISNGSNVKPVVKERGPYVYKEYREKEILSFNDDDTVSYRQRENFVFDQEASGDLTEDEVVTVLNPAYLAIAQTVEGKPFLPGLVPGLFKSSGLFMKKPVSEIFFQGYSFCEKSTQTHILEKTICGMAALIGNNIEKDEENSLLRFSYFGYKNRTDDGVYKIKRGIDDITTLGHIIEWRNSSYSGVWTQKNSSCDFVHGTDSTLYPPYVKKDENFTIFASDVCRNVNVTYNREDNFKGIEGYLFSPSNNTLYSQCDSTGEDCFCSNRTKDINGKESCFLDGVMDLSPCVGAPVILSFPHFLWADHYRNDTIGVTPANEDEHKIRLLVEPVSGSPIEGHRRIQLNAVLRPMKGFSDEISHLPRAMLPLLWVDEGVILTDKYVHMLKSELLDMLKLVDIIQYVMVGVSAVLVIFFGVTVIWIVLRK